MKRDLNICHSRDYLSSKHIFWRKQCFLIYSFVMEVDVPEAVLGVGVTLKDEPDMTVLVTEVVVALTTVGLNHVSSSSLLDNDPLLATTDVLGELDVAVGVRQSHAGLTTGTLNVVARGAIVARDESPDLAHATELTALELTMGVADAGNILAVVAEGNVNDAQVVFHLS